VLVGQRPPVVNLDAIPREITVKAGRRVDLEIPYTGKSMKFLIIALQVSAIGIVASGGFCLFHWVLMLPMYSID